MTATARFEVYISMSQLKDNKSIPEGNGLMGYRVNFFSLNLSIVILAMPVK